MAHKILLSDTDYYLLERLSGENLLPFVYCTHIGYCFLHVLLGTRFRCMACAICREFIWHKHFTLGWYPSICKLLVIFKVGLHDWI